MIRTVIRQVGDQFVVVFPAEDMQRFHPQAGDTIAFIPQVVTGETPMLSARLSRIADDVFAENEPVFRHLADR
jgi:hypothetical protein